MRDETPNYSIRTFYKGEREFKWDYAAAQRLKEDMFEQSVRESELHEAREVLRKFMS